jgi:hypothetical protein
MNNLNDVFNLWTSDMQFKIAFKKNPAAALVQANIQLTPEDYNKVVQRFSADSDTLAKRTNK